jgi:carbonic anhydrase
MTKSLSALCAALAIAVAFPTVAHARDTRPAHTTAPARSPDAIWAELMAGNRRFRDGKPVPHVMTRARLAALSAGQHPKAIIVTCSDSRVPPELLFDQGVGELFVIRLAGNVAAKAAIGSVEYAAEHLGSPLLVVLGHSKCGAVSAAAESASIDASSNIGCILADIAPAVAFARNSGAKDEIDVAVHENARAVAAALIEKSEVLRHLVHEKKLKVVTAVYDLASGAVQLEPTSGAMLH